MNRGSRIILGASLLTVASAVGFFLMLGARAGQATWWTDGSAIRVPAQAAPLREVLWRPAEPLPRATRESGGANEFASTDEYEPRYSADGTTLVFVMRRPGQNADLFTSRWSPRGWSKPEPIDAVNTPADELGPELARDGTSLHFYSDRPGGLGGYDLWVSRASGGGGTTWSTPTNLGPRVNSRFNEYGPALSPAGEHLYFSSNRPRLGEAVVQDESWNATIREHRTRHDYDLYHVPVGDGASADSQPLAALNTTDDEGAPAVSPAGDFLYFASDRTARVGHAAGFGGFDLYRARIMASGVNASPFGPVENLGPGVNSPANDLDPALSSDGFRLCFSSDRELPPGEPTVRSAAAAPSNSDATLRLYSLWSSVSREVYRTFESVSTGPSAWGGWSLIWPWLLLLLLTALLLALAYLLRDQPWRQRFGRLSLVAQCLVISLLIHAGIASLLTIWKVGSGIIDLIQHGGGAGTRVILASAGDAPGGSAVDQIRGAVTSGSISLPQLASIVATAPSDAIQAPRAHLPLPELVAPAPSPPIVLPQERTERSNAEAAAATDPPAIAQSRTDDSSTIPASAPPQRAVAEPSATAPRPEWTAAAMPTAPASASAAATVALDPPRLAAREPATAAVEVPTTRAARPDRTPAITPVPAPAAAVASAAELHLPSARTSPAAEPEPAPSAFTPVTSLTSTPAAPPVAASTASVDLPLAPMSESASESASSTGDGATSGASRLSLDPSGAPRPERTAAGVTAFPSPASESTAGLRLPAEPVTPVETFSQRAPEVRTELLEKMGGSSDTERAVGLALDWFSRHQAPDGHWSAQHFDDRCGRCSGPAEFNADAAMTGMALLCYLGAGHTHTQEGPYQDAVKRGIAWLVSRQGPDGDLRRGETMYGQTVATVVLCEALAMTRDQTLTDPSQRAVAFVLARATGESGGRGGSARGADRRQDDRDTSVLGWLVFTVESARRAGIEVPRGTFDAAAKWLDHVTVPSVRTGGGGRVAGPGGGLYAYAKDSPPSAAMTAEAMFVQQLLGHTRDEPMMENSARFILQTPPKWQQGAPTYYWYYATLALFQHQGDAWARWNQAMVSELLDHQRQEGPSAGSWEPTDEWSRMGGRVYQTAVCTLTLEVYYRYRTK